MFSSMTWVATLSAAAAACCFSTVNGASYNRTHNVLGREFWDFFQYEDIGLNDPTFGHANYISGETANKTGLVHVNNTSGAFSLYADAKTSYSPWAQTPGRASFRLHSQQAFTTHVAVFDLTHMPTGCGTWPAIWEVALGNSWPQGGEVDIVEGANGKRTNQATIHTSPGCSVAWTRAQSGVSTGTDCSAGAGTLGCGVAFNQANTSSFADGFNAQGGGWYAMERADDASIKVWYWSRGDYVNATTSLNSKHFATTPYKWSVQQLSKSRSPPDEVVFGNKTIDTSRWGTPNAVFQSSNACDLSKHLYPHNIIINLDLCGTWSGLEFASDGCPNPYHVDSMSACKAFVNEHPEAFEDAYFGFNAIRVYE